MSEPSTHALSVANGLFQKDSANWLTIVERSQSAIDAATEELRQAHDADIAQRITNFNTERKELEQRAESAEKQVMMLREVVESFKALIQPCGLDSEWPAAQSACDKALSSSTEIAGRYVPIEDAESVVAELQRLMSTITDPDFTIAQTVINAFLARHGDKRK